LSASSTHAVEFNAVTKRFGGNVAVDDVSFVVDLGESVALVGVNGAGKSTLIRIAATTLIADGGSASVSGWDVTRHAHEVRQAVGLCLADERSWYFPLSGRRNLLFFAGLTGLRGSRAADRCDELLTELGLAGAADDPFATYSSGMRLRLSLARALLLRPSVLLLDEATRSLDPAARRAFRGLVDQLVRDEGCAVLESTHDLALAAGADKVIVLREGRIAETAVAPFSMGELEAALSVPSA
jgi:ABC-2 type transport system ATP-binding protein